MEPILKTIAREYSRRYGDLKNICFLFPNKRCGLFLRKYFLEYDVITEDLPHILTISEFVSQLTRQYEAGKIEQLFTLYNCYMEILNSRAEESPVEFEAFRGWGETVLADFNTVDINLADPQEVFKNVKDYREITSNFLTEEQKEVMREYFGVEDYGDAGKFWKNFSDPEKMTSLKKDFLNLWQILYPLHKKFITKLESKGTGTAGSIYRRAAEKLEEKGRDALVYKKIVAIGFNALTESERKIFSILRDEEGEAGYDDYIDFIWDSTGPLLRSENFSASRFVDFNRKHFPMPGWLLPELERLEVTEYPEVTIISAPSNTAQTKVAGEVLEKFNSETGRKEINDAEVALILPDETLLDNMLFSLPDDIGDINLTMGVSLRHSSIATFVGLLRRLYSTMREGKPDDDGNVSRIFYVRDLKILLSHPYSYILFGAKELEALSEYINTNHKVSVSLSEISEFVPSAEEFLHFPGKKEKGVEIFRFLETLNAALIERIEESGKESPEDKDGGQGGEDIAQIKIYAEYLSDLERAVEEYSMKVAPLTLMQMADRMIASEKIGFEGEPLLGLQVMGTLETRSLDFREVIILSMNEGVMPRKAISSTFIPESLRKAYGLPPARYAEEIFGYYFYRLISRVEKVTLIYDGRAISGLRGGESRYLMQLREYLPKEYLKEESWQFRLQNREKRNSSIAKTPEIKEMTKAYLTENEGRKNFSASSLNTYRECQVKFFLQNQLNINSDPEPDEYMDAISVGNVLHDTMMDLYMPENLQRKLLDSPLIIEREKLESLLAHPELIRNLIIKNIRKIYYRRSDGENELSSGVTQIIATQIEELVKEILVHDMSLAPFKLYGCEISRNIRVKMKSGKTVNFRFAIDRLDEIEYEGERRLRIVDYKTGGRKRNAVNMEEMFSGGYESEQLFQLFTYAWLLGKIGMKGAEDVMTEIYFVPDMVAGKDGLPVLEGEKVTGFGRYKDEFGELFEGMIESVFESGEYSDCSDGSSCEWCAFRSFCGK